MTSSAIALYVDYNPMVKGVMEIKYSERRVTNIYSENIETYTLSNPR